MKLTAARRVGLAGLVMAAATLCCGAPPSCGASIAYGARVTGRIIKGSDCRYTFNGQAGDTVTINLNHLDRTLEPHLELRDPEDVIVAENDNAGDSRDSQIRSYTLESDGTYTIVASAHNDDSGGPFELTLKRDLE